MKQRTIATLIVLPPVLICLWLGGIAWAALVLAFGMLGGYEFFSLLQKGGYRPARWLGLTWLMFLLLNGWQPTWFPIPLLLTGGFVITLIHALFQTEKPLMGWIATAAGTLYLGTMLGQILALRLAPDGLWWVLLGLFITWSNDTLAYITGTALGRHRLWPRLSPKKSWEGTIGGWVGAMLVGGLVTLYSPLQASFLTGALVGGAGGVMALFGDLSISMLKRQVGAKDSGRFLPGHGGMLDRLDSVLFVVPFVYQVMLLIT